jgi:hypothetical protein
MINIFITNILWLFRRIKRVIEFIPKIWNGYDFDYIHSINLFHYQLSRTADYLESNKSASLNSRNKAKRLRMILSLMRKVYDEEYKMEYTSKMEQIWGKWNINESKKTFSISWEKADTPQKYKQASDMFLMLSKQSEQKHKRAKKLLWRLIDHNMHNFFS